MSRMSKYRAPKFGKYLGDPSNHVRTSATRSSDDTDLYLITDHNEQQSVTLM